MLIHHFFFMRNATNFINLLKTIHTLIGVGIFSIHVTKVSELLACCDKRWVGLFPFHRMCVSWTALNSWSRMMHELTIFYMVVGGVIEPVNDLWSISESVSNTNLHNPTSQAKSIPSSMAFASASNGPSGTHSFLLIAAMHCPVWSRATTPIPTISRCWNTALSTFTLY